MAGQSAFLLEATLAFSSLEAACLPPLLVIITFPSLIFTLPSTSYSILCLHWICLGTCLLLRSLSLITFAKSFLPRKVPYSRVPQIRMQGGFARPSLCPPEIS